MILRPDTGTVLDHAESAIPRTPPRLSVPLGGHRQVVLENLALRQQLAALKRNTPRPRLRETDRIFWITLRNIWPNRRTALVIVRPDTVLDRQRRRFKRYWRKLSQSQSPGRPRASAEVRFLVRQMATVNPLWGAPRIHGELQNLGIEISERTVSRLIPRRTGPSQTWKTFLKNHAGQLVLVDFFTVPTLRPHVLFVFVVSMHERRRIVHFNVTEHPTAEWTAQQIVEAFPDDTAPRFLIRDRDGICGQAFNRTVDAIGTPQILIAARSPWQNGYAERLIGSIRRECLHQVIPIDERHLCRILRSYIQYYLKSRTHLSLAQDAPDPGQAQTPDLGTIVRIQTGQFYGSVVALRTELYGDRRLHFDTDLENLFGSLGPARILAYSREKY